MVGSVQRLNLKRFTARLSRLCLIAVFAAGWFSDGAQAEEPVAGVAYRTYVGGGASPAFPAEGEEPLSSGSVDAVDFTWASGPVLDSGRSENVIVRFDGWLKPTEATFVYLCAQADDGFLLVLDGVTVVNDWFDKGTSCGQVAYVDFSDGEPKELVAWYYENGGYAEARLVYRYEGMAWTPVPLSWYTQTVPTTTTTTTTTTSTTTTTTTEPTTTTTEPATTTTELATTTTSEATTTVPETTTSNAPEESPTTLEPTTTVETTTSAPTTTWPPTTESTSPTTTPTTPVPIVPAPVTEPATSTTSSTTTSPTTTTNPPTTTMSSSSSSSTESVPESTTANVNTTTADTTPATPVVTEAPPPSPALIVTSSTQNPPATAETTTAEVTTTATTQPPTVETTIAVPRGDASDEEKQQFESLVNVFDGSFDSYVPSGSNVTVAERRTIIAVTATLSAITPVGSRRRGTT